MDIFSNISLSGKIGNVCVLCKHIVYGSSIDCVVALQQAIQRLGIRLHVSSLKKFTCYIRQFNAPMKSIDLMY